MRISNMVGAIRESPLHARVAFAFAILILAALVVTSGARTATAQSGGGYDLTWNTIDGGGV